MSRVFRRLFRIFKFTFYLLLALCVAWTVITLPGLYKIANDSEARAEYVNMLEATPSGAGTESSGPQATFYAAEDAPLRSNSTSEHFISLGNARPSITCRVDHLIYVRTAPGKKHYVEIMVEGGIVETIYGSISEVEKQIPAGRSNFFAGRGLLLNLNYVDAIHCESVPPKDTSYFKLRVNEGCGAAYELRIKPYAIPKFRKKWLEFCQDSGYL